LTRRAGHPFFNDPFFSPFFRDDVFGGQIRRQLENALGSGVIVESDGLVVTNAHVVKEADEITVALNDGREFGARLLLVDEPSDLALLRMEIKEGELLPFAPLKPSESLEVGDLVLAIGNPFGVGQTVTSGIVSAQARSSLDINDFNFFIQTDAAINPGNSGGALVALDGGVVGINTAIYSRDGGSLGIGFAIPSEMVASVIAAADAGQGASQGGVARIVRPWVGVRVQNVTSEIAESLGMDRPRGALVAELHTASPLRKAGVRVGDVVLAVNGKAIRDSSEMKFRMATVPLGDKAAVEIMRAGKHMNVQVEAIAPPDDPPREDRVLEGRHPLNGVKIANLNPAVEVELGLSLDAEGVVVLSAPASGRMIRFLSPGDLLLEINGRKIKRPGDVEAALKAGDSGQGWMFLINSRGRIQRIVIR
jgi:serine protease Do